MESRDLARSQSERGEVLLRQCADGALELRVNGVFVMDTRNTSSEQALADAALAAVGRSGVQVVLGGLGLGFTLARLLHSPDVGGVTVCEIEPSVVRWHRDGLIEQTAALLEDPRVRLAVGDVADTIAALAPGSVDLVLLDVDNGPDFLVYDRNAALYEGGFLTRCVRALRPGGRLAIWSMNRSSVLRAALREASGKPVTEAGIDVRLHERDERYWLYLAEH